MTQCKRVYIVEGPDGAGKSTLALNLAREVGAMVVHHGPYPALDGAALVRAYVDSLYPALVGERPVVLDRCWLSEPIYGAAYRNGADRLGVGGRRHLERLALRCGALLIRCDPGWTAVSETWERRRGDEYLRTVDQLKVVHNAYLHRLVTDLPELRHDYRSVWSVDDYVNWTEVSAPAPHRTDVRSAGWWGARTVLVGEAFGTVKPGDHDYQWPFGSFSEHGCSRWLTDQLADNYVEESELLWVNADQDLGWLGAYIEDFSARVVALGCGASRVLSQLEVPHHLVHHPQYHKRFLHKHRYPLLNLIKGPL